LLLVVALLRFVELSISRPPPAGQWSRAGRRKVDEPKIPLDGFAAHRGAGGRWRRGGPLRRPFIPALAAAMFAVFLAANGRPLVGNSNARGTLERPSDGLDAPSEL